MKTIFYIFAVLTLASSACNSSAKKAAPTPSPTETPIPTATPIPTPVSILNMGKVLENTKSADVGFQLFRFQAMNISNVNFSPLSLKMAFSLLYPGSAGNTEKLLEQIFGFSKENPNPYKAEYDLAAKTAAQKSDDNQLLIENSGWVKNLKSIKDTFRQSLKTEGVEVGKLDLEAINNWVSKTTHDKIPKILESLPAGAQAIFVNAIYFKQKWASPFEAKDTTTDHFEGSVYLSVKTPTLHAKKEVPYYEDKTSKWIELDYANSPFQMFFVLPIKRFDLHAVENEMSSANLDAVTSKMKNERTEIAIPKFKFNQISSFKNLLRNAGYEDLFSHSDYSGISSTSLALSDVIQATSIEVNETGTEASAATATVMLRNAMMKEPMFSKSFIANQPFLFIIRNKDSKEVYWIGKVYNPLESK